jgi:hypothetical protein
MAVNVVTGVVLGEDSKRQYCVSNYSLRTGEIVAYALTDNAYRCFGKLDIVHRGVATDRGQAEEWSCLCAPAVLQTSMG